MGQGLRITFLGYLGQDLQQVVVPPAGEMTSSVDALGLARRLGLEQAQRQLPDPCQVRRTVASPVALIVLALFIPNRSGESSQASDMKTELAAAVRPIALLLFAIG